MGQEAVTIAQGFLEKLELTGIILTRVDGDGRGGAALSMKAVTGCPIKFIGVGEKVHQFERFHPDRLSGRILGMGDVVSMVEKAAEEIDEEEAKKSIKKLQKGTFDMDDLVDQLKQMKKMGGMGGLMSMMPGAGKLKDAMANANIDDKMVDQQMAIVSSMTKKERKDPSLLNGSRKRRIAAGSGTSVQEVNKLLKQFKMMSTMMKKMRGLDKKQMMRKMGSMMPPGGLK